MKYLFPIGILALILMFMGFVLARGTPATNVQYGMTFSVLHTEELGLDWKATYTGMLDELGVRKIRIPVYWSRVESQKGAYEWSEIDFQVKEASARGAEVILVLGRRVPRWPECHVPDWAKDASWDEQKASLKNVITATVERYRSESAIRMWQVENEPYLAVFAADECGELDEAFLDEEIALVRSLDSRPILMTDSGNLGTWMGAYKRGDVFGTSIYLYFWNESVGSFRTALPPSYYRAKSKLARLFFGERPIIVSELSLEPWFGAHFSDVSIDEAIERMNVDKMREILQYANDTGFSTQYLWGVEWWAYMKEKQEHPEYWEAGRKIFGGGQI